MNDDHFLTTEEVLDLLQINLRTVYRLIQRGQLPAVRVGRQWRFRRNDIDKYLNHRPIVKPERPRVLVVDDEQAVRDLLVRTLSTAYDVEAAPDGPAALERLEAQKYDVIITDLRMPGMDGLSVIRQLRLKDSEIRVVIITGYSTEASAVEAINLGVSGYLTKPFRLPRVRQVIARVLGEPVPTED